LRFGEVLVAGILETVLLIIRAARVTLILPKWSIDLRGFFANFTAP